MYLMAHQINEKSLSICEISVKPLRPGYRGEIAAGAMTPGPNVLLRNVPTSDWPNANTLASFSMFPCKIGTLATL
jgi:hypothetical protein